jgi:protein-tyrosine-phosphatase
MGKHKILIVCSGNTCRSPLARVIISDYLSMSTMRGRFSLSSAGISARNGDHASGCAVQIAEELGLDLRKHRAKCVTQHMLNGRDLVLCMTTSHKLHLLHNFENLLGKCFTLAECTSSRELTDPYGSGVDTYRMVARDMQNMLPNLLKFLEKFFHENFDRQ